jgi:transcriptional regulator with XRE-family HTH domain
MVDNVNFIDIETARQRAGLTVLELSRRARIAPSTYWFIKTGRTKARDNTLSRYAQALTSAGDETRSHPARAMYRSSLAYIALQMGFDPAEVSENPNARGFWKARALALSSVAADLGLRHAELGRALGLSKQIVNWNIKQAMHMQDDPALKWYFEAAGKLAAQEAEPPCK